MPDFIGSVDQGTTSTRFMVFDHGATSSPNISSNTNSSCLRRAG